MDKYDELVESERDYEQEDYFAKYELSKEEQIRLCYELGNGAEEKSKYGAG